MTVLTGEFHEVVQNAPVKLVLGVCPQPVAAHTVEFEGFVASDFNRDVIKFAPHRSLNSIA